MLSKNASLHSLSCGGVDVFLVTIEVHISRGLPSFQIVGLPEKSVKESRERVRCAINNSRFNFPNQRVLVNLAPADRPKAGGFFDLPIALAVLIASGQLKGLKKNYKNFIWAGELGLCGDLRPIDQVVPLVLGSQKIGYPLVISSKVKVIDQLQKSPFVFGVNNLLDACSYLQGDNPDQGLKKLDTEKVVDTRVESLDLADIIGQQEAKVALLASAAGRHHLLLHGPPGVGKTMLAHAISGILPLLNQEQIGELALLYAWHGITRISSLAPFRSPHHYVTAPALLGGGVPLQPGEISLAHNGVLFLDEIAEYPRKVLDQLREPMAQKVMHIARAHCKKELPSDFQLLVAMNPCPCGYRDIADRCVCGHLEIARYLRNISGPLLDRIDIGIGLVSKGVRKVSIFNKDQRKEVMQSLSKSIESSEKARSIITKIRRMQIDRQGVLNSQLSFEKVKSLILGGDVTESYLESTMNKKPWGLRAWKKVLTVARTLADCQEEAKVSKAHVDISLGYAQHRNIRSAN